GAGGRGALTGGGSTARDARQHREGAHGGNPVSPVLGATAPETDGGASARLPVGDAAVEHRARVDARRREDARGDGGSCAALADRHDRPAFLLEFVAVLADEPIWDVAAAGDEAVVALVQLADVDHLRAVFE